jgi:hypothetical protein
LNGRPRESYMEAASTEINPTGTFRQRIAAGVRSGAPRLLVVCLCSFMRPIYCSFSSRSGASERAYICYLRGPDQGFNASLRSRLIGFGQFLQQ